MKYQLSSSRRTIQHRLRLRAFAIVIGLLSFTSAALAHDFWIQPSAFTCQVNTPVKVELRVGTTYPGDIVSRLDSRTVKFTIANADGEKPIAGQDGSQTAGVFRPEKPGPHILAYSSTPAFIKLKAANFETYLKDEGLEDIATWRKEHGETNKDGTEIYSRCAKSLVQVGQASEGQNDRAIGLKLELIARSNPSLLKPGDNLTVQILGDGQPLANRTIFAWNAEHADTRISARSDHQGMVRLRLEHSGEWVITSVLMSEAPKDNAQGAQWESLWASLTFQVPESEAR